MRSDVNGWNLEGSTTPYVALAAAVFAASTSAILVRWSHAPSSVAAFYRTLFTTALLAPIALVWYREEFRRLSWRDGGFAAVAGVALAVHFAAWFESLNHTSVAASVTLVQTQPIFVALGAALVLGSRSPGDRPRHRDRDRRRDDHVPWRRRRGTDLRRDDVRQRARPSRRGHRRWLRTGGPVDPPAGLVVPYVTVVYTACAATLFVLVGAQGHDYVAYPAREWLLFLGMAVGPGVFGHTVVNWVLKHLESVVVSVAWLGEPVGATLLALALLTEIPDAVTVVGGLVVLGEST